MLSFTELRLSLPVLSALTKMGISIPTPIQQETIPLTLKGQDLLASAQTGSGKTIAYLIPLLAKLAASPESSALVLAPTRELAMQVHEILQKLKEGSPMIKSALLIGGASMFNQLRDLKRGVRLVIGTPGRINDHLERGSLRLQSTRFLVIDEADRMLDMGFGIQLDRIAEHLPETRQTLLFSATIPSNIEKLAGKYLNNPQRVSINSRPEDAPKIAQEIREVKGANKKSELLKELNVRQGAIIVFVKTKRKADSLAQELQDEGLEVEAIHGDLRQRKREQVIRAFRKGEIRILIATDVAARGIDIPDVMHVINNDLPDAPEDYIHRIGRTGRAGKEGNALSFISPEERHKWRAIERLTKPTEKAQFAKTEERKSFHPPKGPKNPGMRSYRHKFSRKGFTKGGPRGAASGSKPSY